MKTLLAIAAATLSLAGIAGPTAAEAQPRFERDAPRHWNDHDRREARRDYYRGDDRRGYGRQRFGRNTWRDDYGRICYRRSDGVRRCNAPGRYR